MRPLDVLLCTSLGTKLVSGTEESDMLHKLRFVLAGILIIVVNQAVTFAVSARMQDALLPAGTTRYASAYSGSGDNTSGMDGWNAIDGMTKYITIPSGKTADVMVIFCGVVDVDATSTVYARALVRNTLASPSSFLLQSGTEDMSSRCAYFQQTNVAAGTPAVTIQWNVSGGIPSASVLNRSMFVVVNIH